MQKAFRLGVTLFALLCLLGTPARAQQTLGSINGTVKDSSGGVVAKVSAKVRNVATNLTQTTMTRDDGSYNIPDLPVGSYQVTFSHDGFKVGIYSDVLIQGDRTTTLNPTLQPGEVTASVTVSATPLLNQVDTTNGYTMSSELIESTPLGTGSFTQLAILAPGVSADLLATSGTNAG